jgi:hypothetical protein
MTLCTLLVATFAANARAVTIPNVPVGNAGNVGEVQSQGTFRVVAYDYGNRTTEVTVGQYAEFLDAVGGHRFLRMIANS